MQRPATSIPLSKRRSVFSISRKQAFSALGSRSAPCAIPCRREPALRDADKHFRRAIETADEARNDVKSDEIRLSFGTLVREIYDDYVFFLLGAGRVPDALTVAEVSRVQSLADALDGGSRPQHTDLKRLARDHHAVLLSYWLTPKRSYVWTITPNSIEVTELPPAAPLNRKSMPTRCELRSLRGSSASLAHGAELYDMLVAPVIKRIPKGARVIVVPDGRLHAFNMETLVDPATQRYWIESVTIETAGSLELLNRAQAGRGSDSMLLVGDPPAAGAEFPRLSKAAEEMSFVQNHFGAGVYNAKRRASDAQRVQEGQPRPARLHPFCYARHRHAPTPIGFRRHPGARGDSYKLYARDIIKQKLHARPRDHLQLPRRGHARVHG